MNESCYWFSYPLLCLLLFSTQTVTAADSPQRVVSINLCTDQLLLMLAEPSQIASVSYLAMDPAHSFVVDLASAYPLNHARLEQLIQLQPDLVLAGAYSDPRLLKQLQRLGIEVEQFPLSNSIRGIEQDIRHMAQLLGRVDGGEELISSLRAKISEIEHPRNRTSLPKALFYQPRSYTSGSNTLQDEALRIAGWRNLASELGIVGYTQIDLETLLLAAPEQLFTSNRFTATDSLAQQQLDHPALRKLLGDQLPIQVPYKYWICAGPMIADAIAILHAAHGCTGRLVSGCERSDHDQ